MSSEEMINNMKKKYEGGVASFNNGQFATAKTSFLNCINICDRLLITRILLLL